MAKVKPFPTEAALCEAFIASVDKAVWTPYPETAGWDILLVRNQDDFQIGIQAKLRLNVQVVNQTIEQHGYVGVDHSGPDCRAVLVPASDDGAFEQIAAYVGFTIIRVYPNARFDRFRPRLPTVKDRYDSVEAWHEWAPTKRHKLPAYVPDVRAGSPSPVQLTQWKIGALKLQAIMERNGCLVRDDFRRAGMDHRRWLARDSRWLAQSEEAGRWVKGEQFPDFARQHPRVFEEIKSDIAKVEALRAGAKHGELI